MDRVHPRIDQQQSRVSLDARPHRLQEVEIVSDGQHVDRVRLRVREDIALYDAHPRHIRLSWFEPSRQGHSSP
jgi:hypothetical protein